MIQTSHEAAAIQLAEGDNAEDRDSEAADDQTDAIDCIRVRNCLQTAEYGIAHADNAGADADDGDGAEIADAEHTLKVKDLNQCDRTRIQDGRQHGNDICDEEQQREQAHGEGIVAHLEELRDGGDAAAQQLGQEYECQHDQRERRGGLPSHRTHVARKRLSVRADKLFCGKVGHHQRTGDNDAGQSASREEVAFLGGQVVIACFPPREHRDKHGKRNKGCDSKCHCVVSPLFFYCVG